VRRHRVGGPMLQVGENNARVHAAACGALLELAAAPAAGLGAHLGLLTRPVKSQLQARAPGARAGGVPQDLGLLM
jgi:hypothetical protein